MGLFKSEKHGYEDDSDSENHEQVTQEQFNLNDILICATHGKIYAIHKTNGNRLWRTNFPGHNLGSVVSLFVTDYDKLIAGANGKTACIDIMTGNTIWVNNMEGFGYEEVSVISTPSRFLSPKRHPNTTSNNRNGESLPQYHNDNSMKEAPVVIGSSRGKVLAINSATGEQIWKYKCPGGGYSIPVTIVEPPSLEDGRPEQLIYVGSGKWVYCLKAGTGEVVWSCRVSNAKLGSEYMTLATPWSSRLAAEAYSAFSQNPSAQAAARQREENQTSG